VVHGEAEVLKRVEQRAVQVPNDGGISGLRHTFRCLFGRKDTNLN
jgi:hypothetical protein